MTCPACGTPTVAGAHFCFHCGASLAGVPTDVTTERRVVTVLFGDLSEFTSWAEDLDPERVGVVTDRVLASLAEIVGEFGGTVDKLTGDGIMAVFGAPTAHEDDAERAVRAAARMQAVVRRLVEAETGGGQRLGLRVGLNTGEVVAGVQAQLSYTVIGDTVNTAARLSDAAGVGTVLAGRATAIATMAAASWRTLPRLRLRGKREPVPAYELVGLRPGRLSRLGLGDEAPFLGRDTEFGTLVGRLLDAVDGNRSCTVVVAGEAGVGKTRLAQELAHFAGELPGARVLWGRCAPYGVGRDLTAVADMVRTACGIGEADDVAAARERVARTVVRLEQARPVPPGVADRLVALLGLEDLPGAGQAAGATPGAPIGGDPVRQAVSALFTGLAASGPLVLVLEDVHWATPTMLDGVLDLSRRVRGGVLLLALGRPDMLEVRAAGADPDAPPWWQAMERAELLVLPPLGESASERLLQAYLGSTQTLDQRVRDAILQRAQGNPFFLAELLHLLVDRGLLRRGDDGWELDSALGASGEGQPSTLPAGVQAVLAARIDGLDGAAKGVLRDASVIGLTVTLDGLEAVGRASGHGRPEVVRSAVAALVDRRLLEPVRDAGEGGAARLRFAHTLVRDVAYAGLTKGERARRHAAAGEHVLGSGVRSGEEDMFAANHGERAIRLATEMGLPPTDPAWSARPLAFTALARLGQAALNRDDSAGAERALARALALAGPGPGTPLGPAEVEAARVARARALAQLHRLDEAEAELAPALSRPDGTGDGAVRAAALAVLGDVRRKQGDAAGARTALTAAHGAARAAGSDPVAAEALRELGLLDYFDGQLRSAEERFREAHDVARRVGDLRGAGWALQHLAWSATTRGDYALATEVLEQAADVFVGLDDHGGLSWVAGTEGFVRLLQGRLSEARELAGALLPVGQELGERWGVAALLVIDALAAAELGEVALAADEAERARAGFEAVADVWGQALALTACGIAARGAGDPDRAVALCGEAVRLAEVPHPVIAGLALVAAGHAELDRGDLDGAERAGRRAEALHARLDLEPHAALGAQVLLAQVQRRRGRPEEALATLDAALAQVSGPALLFPLRQALSHRAGTLLDLGRREEALQAARAAVAVGGEDVRSQVMSLRGLSAALRACGDQAEADRVLAEALAASRATGMRAEIAGTERLLGTTR